MTEKGGKAIQKDRGKEERNAISNTIRKKFRASS
jgi:hypothetical protein